MMAPGEMLTSTHLYPAHEFCCACFEICELLLLLRCFGLKVSHLYPTHRACLLARAKENPWSN